MVDTATLKSHFDMVMARRQADVPFSRFEAAQITSDGIRLHLDVIAVDDAAATVVLVPGTSVYGLVYGDMLAGLADAGFNAVSVDPRGHGRSDGRRGSYTIPELVADARAAVAYARDRFGAPVVLAGSSQGGIVAFYCAATDEKLAGAVCHNIADLANPASAGLTDRQAAARLMKPLAGWLAAVFPELPIPIKGYLNLLSRGHEDIKARLAADPLSLKVIRLKALASLGTAPLPCPVEQISTPVLILHGARDTIFPQRYVEELYGRLRCHKELKIYPELDHFLCTDNVPVVLPDVVSWIRQVCRLE